MGIFKFGPRFGSGLARAAVPQHVRIRAIARKEAMENAQAGKPAMLFATIAVAKEEKQAGKKEEAKQNRKKK